MFQQGTVLEVVREPPEARTEGRQGAPTATGETKCGHSVLRPASEAG